MVTGGLISGVDILDSTEIFSSLQESSEDTNSILWKTLSGKLPIPLVGLRVATINNRVLSFGIENFLSLSSRCHNVCFTVCLSSTKCIRPLILHFTDFWLKSNRDSLLTCQSENMMLYTYIFFSFSSWYFFLGGANYMRFEVSPVGNYVNTIFEFNYETETWSQIGTMKGTRFNHAVSLVSYDDYSNWCN